MFVTTTLFSPKQLNTSPAKLVNPQILFLQRKTVSFSWLVSRVGVGGRLMLSRVDSRRKLGSEVRIRRVDIFGIWNSGCFR